MIVPFVPTRSGKRVDLRNPDPASIDIEDIAVALSRIPRFNGHTRHFYSYSVAQHSVIVADMLDWDRETRLRGLLHDAHEAYIGDIVTPVKSWLGGRLDPLARELDRTIAHAFDLFWPTPAQACFAIKQADHDAFVVEACDLLNGFQLPPPGSRPPHPPIVPLSSAEAEALFLERFYQFRDGRRAAQEAAQ
jgi:5'-deoxynucleotidase YfbR-like HD superfamily hydrolase